MTVRVSVCVYGGCVQLNVVPWRSERPVSSLRHSFLEPSSAQFRQCRGMVERRGVAEFFEDVPGIQTPAKTKLADYHGCLEVQ